MKKTAIQGNPYILEETENYAVVFKPPRMHCAPNNRSANYLETKTAGGAPTLLDWFAGIYPPVVDLRKTDGGLVHRLDYETQGLVLFAKNQKAIDSFLSQQEDGVFIKEYSAVCEKTELHQGYSAIQKEMPGFPPPPGLAGFPPSPVFPVFTTHEPLPDNSLVIESFFRPFGPGRKLVRPVIEAGKYTKEIAKDKGAFYRTEIITRKDNFFTVRIKRGFRHQIRCHLSWIGYPICNDPLYNAAYLNTEEQTQSPAVGNYLALRAHVLSFIDPVSNKKLEYHINPIF